MNYGEILSKAWKIIWKHKVLWIFGILAGFSSSPGNSTSSSYSYESSGSTTTGPNIFGQNWDRLFQNINIPPAVIVLFVFLAIILVIVGILLVTIGKIGLIRGASQADEGAEHLSFGQLFNSGMHYFWRVLLLNILMALVVFVVVAILAIPVILVLVGLAATVVGLLCVVPLICVMAIIGWLFGIFIEQSTVALVTEDLGVMDALRRGWKVVTRYAGQYIVMGVILGIIGGVAAFLIGLPLFALILPPLAQLAITGREIGAGLTVSVVLFLLYLPVLLVLNGILQSYLTTAWTLTYRRVSRLDQSAVEVFPAPPPPTPPYQPA